MVLTILEKKIQKALKENNINSKFIKNKLNCYASVDVGEEKLFSINGLDDGKVDNNSNQSKTIEIIKKLLGEETNAAKVEYVSISDDTRYYFSDTGYINYIQFKKENLDHEYNRMFTCCERKLIAKIRGKNEKETDGEKIDIVLNITKKPCELCEREIKIVKAKHKNPNREINKDEKKTELKIEEMDAYAREIYKKHRNK